MLLEDIDIILAVTKTGSFSQAAKELHLSRPALSQKINFLEAKYGIELYKRTTQGVAITQAGSIVAKFANRVQNMHDAMEKELLAYQDTFIPTVTVGVSEGDGASFILPIVAKYRQANDSSNIHVAQDRNPALFSMVRSQEIDFALVKGQPVNDEMGVQLLGYRKYVCIAPNRKPWNEIDEPIRIIDLIRYPMIVRSWSTDGQMAGNDFFEHYGFQAKNCNIVASADSFEALAEGVRCGLGLAWVPEAIAEKEILDCTVKRIEVNSEPLYYPISLIYYKKYGLSEECLEFIDFMKNSIPDSYFEEAFVNQFKKAQGGARTKPRGNVLIFINQQANPLLSERSRKTIQLARNSSSRFLHVSLSQSSASSSIR